MAHRIAFVYRRVIVQATDRSPVTVRGWLRPVGGHSGRGECRRWQAGRPPLGRRRAGPRPPSRFRFRRGGGGRMKSYNASGEGGALQGSERRSASFSAERPPSSSSPTTNGCTSAWPLVIQDCATSPASSPRRNLSHTLVSIRTVNASHLPSAAARLTANRAESRMPPQPAAAVGVDQFLQAKFHHGGLGLARWIAIASRTSASSRFMVVFMHTI